jgi:hypothetical protein
MSGGARAWLRGWPLVVLFALSLPAVTPRIYASDEVQYFAWLRSLWFDRDVSFDNEYRHFYERGLVRSPGFHETFLERTTETGRRLNFGTIGCAILWSPFYAAGHAVALASRGRQVEWPADGYSPPYVAAVAYGSAVYGLLALLISAAVAERLTGHGRWPALVVWLGTPLVFYMYVAPPMAHACSAFAVAAFVAAWLAVRRRWSARGTAALGALGALVAMVREQDAFFLAGPALDFAVTWLARAAGRGDPRLPSAGRLLASAAAGAAAALAAYLPQAVAYIALNGHLGPSRLVARKMTWSSPHAVEVLLSPEHGFFVWTPLALAGLAGLFLLLRPAPQRPWSAEAGALAADRPWLGGCLLVMFALQVYIAGSIESWTVAGAFGQRRFVSVTVLLVIGLAALAERATRPRARAALAALALLAVWWNVGLMAQFGAGLMDRQRLEPARNAYTTFVELPRLFPDLVRRYLYDRSSFYAPDR